MATTASEAATFAELKAALARENYARAVEICNKIRSRVPEDPDAIKIKCIALIRLGKFDKALELASRYPALTAERLYCLYRLRQDDDALALLPSVLIDQDQDTTAPNVSPALLHVAAQLHFRRGHFDQCIPLYEYLLRHAAPGDDVMEVQANLLAAYASAGRCRELVTGNIPTDDSFEVAFNKSFIAIAKRDWVEAEELLEDAQRLCHETFEADGMTDEEIASSDEAALITTQLAFVKQMRGDVDGALADYRTVLKTKLSNQAVGAVAANNLVSIRKDRDLFDSLKRLKAMDTILQTDKLMPVQKEAILANRTLVLCLMNKTEECQESLQALQEAFPQSPMLFALVVLIASKEHNQDRAVAVLEENKTLGGRLGLAHLYLTQNKVAQAAETLAAIEAIAHTPGTVATLIALYEAAGNNSAAQDVLARALEYHRAHDFSSPHALKLREGDARHKIAKREFEEAAKIYTELMEGANADVGALDPKLRLQALASLVVALSYSDAEAAEQRCALLPPVEPSDTSIDQLLEHQAQRSRRLAAALTDASEKKIERKRAAKNPERIARKRAKRREAHLAYLRSRPDYNASIGLINPDPERWIPKKQRSYAKRGRRGRNRFVGAQGAGAGTEKDAAKLDAAARAAKKAEIPEEKKAVVVTSSSSAVLRKSKKKKRR